MLITPDNFDKINQKYLENLIKNGIEENIHLDYKTAIESNQKIAKEISSFANKDGGNIIYGIHEIGNKPVEIIPITQEGFREKIEQIALNGIDPPLKIRIKPVDVNVNDIVGQAYIIYIPKKYPRLHQAKHYKKYYQRVEFTSTPMSNSEIELAFNLSYESNRNIKEFLDERLLIIKEGGTPVFIENKSKIIMHIIPFDSLIQQVNFDLEILEDNEDKILPINCYYGRRFRRNIDGYLCSCISPEREILSYTQLYRNGIIEAVDGSLLRPHIHKHTKEKVYLLDINQIERSLIKSVENYLSTLEELNVGFPLSIFMLLSGVHGYFIDLTQYKRYTPVERTKSIDRVDLYLPEIIIENYDINIEQILKPSIDLIWNACGEKYSLNYDDNGNYKWKI